MHLAYFPSIRVQIFGSRKIDIMKYVRGMLNDAIKLMICCHVATLDGLLLLLWVCTTQKYVEEEN